MGDKEKHPYLATHPSIFHDKFFASNNGAQDDPIFHNGQQNVFQLSITISPKLRIMPSQGGQLKQWTFGNGIFTFRWVQDGQFLVYAENNVGFSEIKIKHVKTNKFVRDPPNTPRRISLVAQKTTKKW